MKILTSTFAIAASVLMAVPATAQVNTGVPPVAGETALQYAQRINACGGAGVESATFTQNRTRLSVRCPQQGANTSNNGMSGGLGTAIALGAGMVLIIAGAAGDSSSTVTTTN